jgi:hypothetical protein
MHISSEENKSTSLGPRRDLDTDHRRPRSQPINPPHTTFPPTAIPDATSFIRLRNVALQGTTMPKTTPFHIRHIHLKRLVQCAEHIEIRDGVTLASPGRDWTRPARVVSASRAIHRLDSDTGGAGRTDNDGPWEQFRVQDELARYREGRTCRGLLKQMDRNRRISRSVEDDPR